MYNMASINNYNKTEKYIQLYFTNDIKDKILNYAFYSINCSVFNISTCDYFILGYYEKCEELLDYITKFKQYENEITIGISNYLYNCSYVNIINLILSKIKPENFNKIDWTYILGNICLSHNIQDNHLILELLLNKIDIDYINWNYILKDACKGNNINTVKYIVKKIKDMNLYVDWYYAIIGICEGGDINIFKFIINEKIPLFNSYDWNDFLYKAYEYNNIEIIKFLDKKNLYFKYPLFYYWKGIFRSSCKSGNINLIIKILNKCPSIIENYKLWKFGVYEALENNNIMAYKYMTCISANYNGLLSYSENDILMSPKICKDLFSIACKKGYIELFNLILDKIKLIDNLIIMEFYILNTINNISLACKGGNIEIISFLFKNSKISESYKKKLYNNCMVNACKLGNIDVIKLININL